MGLLPSSILTFSHFQRALGFAKLLYCFQELFSPSLFQGFTCKGEPCIANYWDCNSNAILLLDIVLAGRDGMAWASLETGCLARSPLWHRALGLCPASSCVYIYLFKCIFVYWSWHCGTASKADVYVADIPDGCARSCPGCSTSIPPSC